MTGLLILPLELVLEVFNAQQSLQDALQLSSTCRALRQIFLKELRQVSFSILRRNIAPCYGEFQTLINEMVKHGQVVDPGVAAPPNFAIFRAQSQLIRDGNMAIDAFHRYFTGPHRDSQWRCELGICYVNRPDYSPSDERVRLLHAFLFVRLCVVAYNSPSLTDRCTETICNMPCLDAWFIDYVTIGLFEDRIIDATQARTLGILDPHIEYDEDLFTSDWIELASPQWRHVLDVMDKLYDDRYLGRKTGAEKALDKLHATKAEGCNCEPVTLLTPNTATGAWLEVFQHNVTSPRL